MRDGLVELGMYSLGLPKTDNLIAFASSNSRESRIRIPEGIRAHVLAHVAGKDEGYAQWIAGSVDALIKGCLRRKIPSGCGKPPLGNSRYSWCTRMSPFFDLFFLSSRFTATTPAQRRQVETRPVFHHRRKAPLVVVNYRDCRQHQVIGDLREEASRSGDLVQKVCTS